MGLGHVERMQPGQGYQDLHVHTLILVGITPHSIYRLVGASSSARVVVEVERSARSRDGEQAQCAGRTGQGTTLEAVASPGMRFAIWPTGCRASVQQCLRD